MTEKLILQIGRLDKSYQKDLKFVFESKEYFKPLSSLAFKEHFNNETKVILLYPISLILNKDFKDYKGEDAFLKIVKSILTNNSPKIEEYIKDPYETYKQHPHSAKNTYEVLHSLGTYSGQTFSTTMHDLIIYIWCLIVREYLENGFKEIYVDISSGLNFYMASLLEALRYFLVWQQLYELKTKKVKGLINYTDPILGTDIDKINIYTYEVSYKSFFTSTLDNKNYQEISKYVFETALSSETLKKEVNPVLEEFLILFSALYRPAPLILFTKKYPELKTVEDIITKTVDATIEKYTENWAQSPGFQFEEFSKILMALGFMRGLRKFMDENNIYFRGYTTYNDLENLANNIENNLGLKIQAGLLKTELKNNFRNKNFHNEWKSLKEFLVYDTEKNTSKDKNNGNDSIPQNIDQRNFFAHTGFERNITLVKKENDEIFIKYDETQMEKIKKLLKKGIKGE